MADALETYLILPTKPFEEGKSRLSEVLTATERYALNRRFFLRTLGIGRDVFRQDRIVVVSRSAEALDFAGRMGARPIQEKGSSLIEALDQATAEVLRAQARRVLALSCDLPTLSTHDIVAMIGASRSGPSVTIAGDRNQVGTNALLVAPPASIAYRFGDGSFTAHLNGARSAGLEPIVIRRFGLAFDVDTPADLRELVRDAV